MSFQPEEPDDREHARPWRSRLVWLALLVVGVLVFEVTANPLLGVSVGCLKFGLKDFRTALWVRRADPDRVRGQITSWFLATYGIFRTGVAALAALVLLANVVVLFDRQGIAFEALQGQAMATVLTLLASYLLGMVTAVIGVTLALIRGRRIWIDHHLYDACRDRTWPPRYEFASFLRNKARMVVLGAAVVYLFAVMMLLMIFGIAVYSQTVLGWAIGNPNHLMSVVLQGVVLGFVAVGIFGSLVRFFSKMMEAMTRRVAAVHPWLALTSEEQQPASWPVSPLVDDLS